MSESPSAARVLMAGPSCWWIAVACAGIRVARNAHGRSMTDRRRVDLGCGMSRCGFYSIAYIRRQRRQWLPARAAHAVYGSARRDRWCLYSRDGDRVGNARGQFVRGNAVGWIASAVVVAVLAMLGRATTA